MILSSRLLGLGSWLILLLTTHCTDALMLLSDLTTPALVIDVDHFVKQSSSSTNTNRQNCDRVSLPTSIVLPNSQSHLKICHDADDTTSTQESPRMITISDPAIRLFWHASVICSRDTDTDGPTEDTPLFLASLDVPFSTSAHLVLGWNNHHVISYYWARSSGAGAAMEAPGISLTDKSELVWSSPEGPRGCQSNDGKRSEWVNFLRPGDQVQLLPNFEKEDDSRENTVLRWCNHCSEVAEKDTHRYVYGISSQGRPLGSEPFVVAKWKWILEES